MGGKSGPSAPPAPNPTKLINQQTAANKDALITSAKLNAINQIGPGGSITYKRDANGVPVAQVTTLNDVGQRTFKANERVGLNLAETALDRIKGLPKDDFSLKNARYDPSKVNTHQFKELGDIRGEIGNDPRNQTSQLQDFQPGELGNDPRNVDVNAEFSQFGNQRDQMPFDPRSVTDINAYDKSVRDAFMEQQRATLDPAMEMQFERQIQNLADRGIPIDSKAYQRAMSNLNRDQAAAYQSASNNAILQSGSEAQRQLGMQQGLRTQAWQEATGENQINNQNAQQRIDTGTNLRSTAFQEALAGNTAQNQIASNRLAENQGLRSGAMGEASAMHNQQTADRQQKLQVQQNLRNQMIQEDILQRNQNANEAAMLMGQAPAMAMPTPGTGLPGYNMQSPDAIGANLGAFGAQMQGYNAQQQASGSAWQGAANIAGGLMKSSKAYKHDDGDPGTILDKLDKMPVRTWRYRREIDPREEIHIGPYAEDWKRILGFGNGKEIAAVDAIGVALKCLQELYGEVKDLREQVRALSPKKAPRKRER